MTILSLPSWFDALECELQLVPEVRGFQGPFGGPTEVADLLGDRWRMRLVMPDGDFTWGGRTGALFNRLRGGANWLRIHDLAKPVPGGTARGSLVLAVAAAQGANALSLSGAISSNVIPGGSFEIDSNADGLADGWSRYSAGSVTGLSAALSSGVAVHGNTSQSLSAATLGSTSSDRQGITRSGLDVTSLAGLDCILSCVVVGTINSSAEMQVAWRDAGGTVIGGASTSVAMTTGYQTLSVSCACPSAAVTAILYIFQHSNSGPTPGLYVDAMQLEAGIVRSAYAYATLRAGDKLGHNGEQLFEVAEDATANDLGAITVPISNRLRKSVASGQAIGWNKPQIPWQLTDAGGVPTAFTRGRARGQQVEFVEAWQ